MKPKTKPPTVLIVWLDENIETIRTLAYDGGTGQVRTYVRDCYDGRLNLGREGKRPLPYFRSVVEALLWCSANLGQQCQLDVREAHKIGLAHLLAEVA